MKRRQVQDEKAKKPFIVLWDKILADGGSGIGLGRSFSSRSTKRPPLGGR